MASNVINKNDIPDLPDSFYSEPTDSLSEFRAIGETLESTFDDTEIRYSKDGGLFENQPTIIAIKQLPPELSRMKVTPLEAIVGDCKDLNDKHIEILRQCFDLARWHFDKRLGKREIYTLNEYFTGNAIIVEISIPSTSQIGQCRKYLRSIEQSINIINLLYGAMPNSKRLASLRIEAGFEREFLAGVRIVTPLYTNDWAGHIRELLKHGKLNLHNTHEDGFNDGRGMGDYERTYDVVDIISGKHISELNDGRKKGVIKEYEDWDGFDDAITGIWNKFQREPKVSKLIENFQYLPKHIKNKHMDFVRTKYWSKDNYRKKKEKEKKMKPEDRHSFNKEIFTPQVSFISGEVATVIDSYEEGGQMVTSEDFVDSTHLSETAEATRVERLINSIINDTHDKAICRLLMQGMSYRDIAEEEGISRSSVERRVKKIRELFKKEL